ncbi:hypothetical protein HL033_01300 [Neoehrlichia mikurensis]|uniref:Uncharacterized protein n=1 Tax=Neoehrlichia mikurensis TaxID=89586 RepID=A0A9Q9BTX8_9RICK|nr:hypothetical protein [Neoehrlichia mikurensis]QXK92191.1 hypothetical protein IAH97_01295 [Neoehrlichia mikurensis]QXK92647.1 hypothetical protein HUN61_01295 [Neoehrlichia mikurensis]QXK93884.1 hypothetical protein HL033_01300 [Neoehrlichia mikurensis]UTO55118.1 hypothetical protein LUA82_02815 [Neoehrlichia mikurensis]UTO56038.1 hypothetical protein LUA81_02795 [Neoehrlichia mikurensis]
MLKRGSYVKLVTYSILLVLLLCIFCSVCYYNYNIKLSISDIKSEIQKINFEIVNLHKHETELNNNFTVWQEISNSNVYSMSHVNNLESLINTLCVKYKILSPQIIISSPILVSDNYKKQYIDVVRHNIVIRFTSITDENVFLFMHAVKYDIPGYIAVRSFELTKSKEITHDIIKHNLAGDFIPVVYGNVVFDLYSISGKSHDEHPKS